MLVFTGVVWKMAIQAANDSPLEPELGRKVSPLKINMEPTNHPFRKENDLPNPYDYVPC